MTFFPKIVLATTSRDGTRYAIITHKWLWETVLFEIPILREFWPADSTSPLPKGIRFPKQPIPTEYESRLVAEMIESKGFKVLKKFWNWQTLVLAHRCTEEKDDIETVQGMFQGFLRAKIIPIQIAEWSREQEEMEDEGSMYANQRQMDKEAPGAYY